MFIILTLEVTNPVVVTSFATVHQFQIIDFIHVKNIESN